MLQAPLITNGARRTFPSVEWLRSPARPALQVASALDRVRRAPAILPAMRTVPALLSVVDDALAEGVPAKVLLEPILEAIDDEHDTLSALAAVHALARVPGVGAEEELLELIVAGAPGYEDHALWAIGGRRPTQASLRPVARAVARGSLPGMHAQRALAGWSATDPEAVLVALEMTLLEHHTPEPRRYLAETIGLVPGLPARQSLERIARDADEYQDVRATAVAAFVDRPSERLPRSIGSLMTDTNLAPLVRSVRAQRHLRRRGPRIDDVRDGLRVAQIHLGEMGGLATLMPQLGSKLAARPRISEVITITRGEPGDARTTTTTSGHRQERLPLEPGDAAQFTRGWPALVAAARGIRSSFLAAPLPDVVHLRVADPASLAGAMVARELGVRIVFTLAADPHVPIAAAEEAGEVDRGTFAGADARDGLWFRAHLVERLAQQARELVLFPRAQAASRMEHFTGIDITSGPPRATVVAEGIDTDRIDHAARSVASANRMPDVLGDLQGAVGRLPRARHGLPLLVSVGRLHEIKGMARLVEAFAEAPELASRANLVIVGGNLDRPSAAEAAELARIQRVFERLPHVRDQVVLLGQRPNEDVALVLAATHAGWGALVAPGGAYVCASAKEEFGLAIIEALAAGLPVVAPLAGGPATYVKDGVTGVLVRTTEPRELARGGAIALLLAQDSNTALRTRALVDQRFTLERMARDLSAVYRITAGAGTLGHPVEPGSGTST